VAVHVGVALLSGVADGVVDGVADGVADAGGPADGVVAGAGLVADPQAATSRAAAIVASREREGRMPMSSGRYIA
jgi:hypothetical protein